jgi:hypothetical protein
MAEDKGRKIEKTILKIPYYHLGNSGTNIYFQGRSKLLRVLSEI